MKSTRSDDAAPGIGHLLRYFEQAGAQPPRPIAHPDKRVNARIRKQDANLRQASVLIPVIHGAVSGDNHIVLTVRSENLKNHAGQISFPGGSTEPGDRDEVATALRETHEEIGIRPEQVRVLGKLGDMALPSGFLITPVVGLIEPGLQFAPCPVEVADIFQVPLELAMDPRAYRDAVWHHQDEKRRVLELCYEDYRIWGATAAILFHLASEISAGEITGIG